MCFSSFTISHRVQMPQSNFFATETRNAKIGQHLNVWHFCSTLLFRCSVNAFCTSFTLSNDRARTLASVVPTLRCSFVSCFCFLAGGSIDNTKTPGRSLRSLPLHTSTKVKQYPVLTRHASRRFFLCRHTGVDFFYAGTMGSAFPKQWKLCGLFLDFWTEPMAHSWLV